MSIIHNRILRLIENSGKSLRQVALEAGLIYPTLHSSITKERELSFTTIDTLATYFGISTHYFSTLSESVSIESPAIQATLQARATMLLNDALAGAKLELSAQGLNVGLETFLNWWYENSGRLENFDLLANRVDIFNPPENDARVISPVTVGRCSLAALRFDVQSESQLVNTLDGFTSKLNDSLVEAHLFACKMGEPVITHPALDERLPSGKKFKERYRRVLAPVYTADGQMLIANFSQSIVRSGLH